MSLRWNDAARTLDLSVHDLLDAEAVHVRRLTMSGRARLAAGVALHKAVQRERAEEDEGFRAEERVRHTVTVRGWACTVHGRVDGVLELGDATLVEEIKSTGLDADALHEAEGFPTWERQLAWYVHFLRVAGRPAPTGVLRVVSLVDGAQRAFRVDERPEMAEALVARLDPRVRAREERLLRASIRRLATVPFPHAEVRPGQGEASDRVCAAVRSGRHLLLVAPTGTGKTAALLHGALRAAFRDDLRLFWATSRTTQQAVVEATLESIAARGLDVRAVTLRAREKACLNGVVDCRPEVCPYADRYAERVEAALAALPDRADGDACAAVGRSHRVCPYELALDRAATADVVIGDSNWVFEPGRRALADEPDWTVIVDEAHQLPDRASDALSPELSRAAVDGALAMIPAEGAWLAFARLAADISDAVDDAPLLTVGEVEGAAEAEAIVELDRRRWDDLRDRVDELAIDHAVLRLRAPLREDGGEDPWETLARATIRFVDALDRAGDETVALWRPLGLRLVNRDPSRVLGPRFGAVRSVVCTSATLTPTWFFRERCGLDPDRVDEHVVEPSFPPENRRVLTVPGVSTAYAKRDAHRESIVEILQKTVKAVPGNVALYFGSFDQLDDLLGDCAWPEREVLRQARGLSDEARAALLARMRDAPDGRPRVLAAVLGGVFAEGVDLPGAALRAVVVVGPSLPPPSAELALRRAWWEERFDDGFDLSSIQPGMTRVVQAAGRVVRSADERGLVVLLCARFLQHAYAAYLPSWWDVHKARRPWIEAAEFFAGDPA